MGDVQHFFIDLGYGFVGAYSVNLAHHGNLKANALEEALQHDSGSGLAFDFTIDFILRSAVGRLAVFLDLHVIDFSLGVLTEHGR